MWGEKKKKKKIIRVVNQKDVISQNYDLLGAKTWAILVEWRVYYFPFHCNAKKKKKKKKNSTPFSITLKDFQH